MRWGNNTKKLYSAVNRERGEEINRDRDKEREREKSSVHTHPHTEAARKGVVKKYSEPRVMRGKIEFGYIFSSQYSKRDQQTFHFGRLRIWFYRSMPSFECMYGISLCGAYECNTCVECGNIWRTQRIPAAVETLLLFQRSVLCTMKE